MVENTDIDALNRELNDLRSDVKEIVEQLGKISSTLESIAQSVNMTKGHRRRGSGDVEDPDSDLMSYMETLKVLDQFEDKHGRGAIAKEIAQERDLQPPTIYGHLELLSDNNMVFFRRGSVLGLSPANAKFFYPTNRADKPSLWSINDFTSLSEDVQRVARTIIDSGEDGITEEALNEKLSLSPKKIENGLKELLKRVLIDYQVKSATKTYFVTQQEA